MHKKIIAGVMSTLICAAALSPDAGVFATQYSTKKGAVTAENGKINSTKEISVFDLGETEDDKKAEVTENSETVTETIGAVTGNDAEEIPEDVTPLIAAVPADEDIIETVELGENITGYVYSNGLLRIHGYGDLKDFSDTPFKNFVSITQILFENEDTENNKKITSIGQCIFSKLENLTSASCDDITKAESGVVQIPDSVTSIGVSAFSGCSSIKEVKLNNGLKEIHRSAFAYCKSLTDFIVPDSVTVMEINMLYECKAIKTLQLPYAATLKSIADGEENITSTTSIFDLFYEYGAYENTPDLLTDYSLSKITITGGENIPEYAFAGMATLKEIDLSKTKVTSIGNYAFFNCNSLENVVLNENIESVGNYAFAHTPIKTLPDNKKIKTLGFNVFEGCMNLTDVTVPESYQSLGNCAFCNCTNITNLVIQDNVTSMGVSLFYGCTNLKSLTLPYASTLKSMSDGEEKITSTTSVFDLFYEYGAYENAPDILKDYSISKITITGGEKIPDYAFAGMATLKEIDLSKSKISSIGNYAFYNCNSLENVILNENVESIENYAFANTAIKTLPDNKKITTLGNHVFAGCKGLSDITIPESYKSLGDNAFRDCTGITELVIPENIISIGVSIFYGCTNLKTLTLPYAATSKNISEINSSITSTTSIFDLFYEYGSYDNDPEVLKDYSISKITITGGEKIPAYAFAGMATLKEIDLSSTKALIIGDGAFLNCTALEKISIPDTVNSINHRAFYNCTSISDLKLNKRLEHIGSNAFENCTGIHSLVIPESVTSMDPNMLRGCTNLETLQIPYAGATKECTDAEGKYNDSTSVYDLFIGYGNYENNPEDIKDYSISKIIITGGEKVSGYAFSGMSTLKEIDLSKSKVNSISEYAFYNCTSLENVILNENIETVGNYAYAYTAIKTLPDNKKINNLGDSVFEGCKGLTDITIPESYQSMGNYAFRGCAGITELVIPENVTSMGAGIFNGCTKLTALTLPYAATSKSVAESDGTINDLTSVFDLFVPYGNRNNDPESMKDYSISEITITGGEKIPDFAFAGIPTLKKVDLSGTEVNEIGEYAFNNCAAVDNIVLPKSVKTVNNGAFQSCTGLSNIKLNDGLETIGNDAFLNCTGLKTLTVPDTVISMGINMLRGCTNLEELVIPYAAREKSSTDKDGAANENSSVSDIFITYGTYENATDIFEDYSISKITVTGGETVPKFAFSGFSTLTDIDLSNTKAESIGECAFYNCTSAEKITLPETVNTVGKSAFANANSDVYIYNPECTISENAFSDDYSGTIHGLTESSVKNLSDNKEYKFDALDDEIIIGPVNISLMVGETYKINSNKKDLQYKSSDTEIVNVSDDGVISAEKEGKASVEVKAADDKKSSMNIWVRTPVVVTEPAVTTTEPAVTTPEPAATVTEASVTTTEPEITSVSDTEPTSATSAPPVTTTVTETEQTTVTSTEPVTTTVTETEQTTVTSTEPVTTTVTETEQTTVTSTEPVTTTVTETEQTTVTSTEPVTTTVTETEQTTVTTVTTTEPVTTSATAAETTTVTTVTTTEPVTTSVSETEETTVTTVTSEEAVTTSETEAEVTVTEAENNSDGKLFNIGSLEEIANMALVDYSLRTGSEAAEAIVIPITAENYKIEIKDENGNILDTYTINPKTGEGTTSENEPVNLPQTGNNSTKNLFTAFAALLMAVLGAAAMKFSGIFDRRRKNSK